MIVQNVVGTQKKEQSAEGRTQGSFHCDVTCYLTLEGYAKWEGEEKKKGNTWVWKCMWRAGGEGNKCGLIVLKMKQER